MHRSQLMFISSIFSGCSFISSNVECRQACEDNLAPLLTDICNEGSADADICSLEQLVQECQQFPEKASEQECGAQFTTWMVEERHVSPDCGCLYLDELDADLAESLECEQVINEYYEGSTAELRRTCNDWWATD